MAHLKKVANPFNQFYMYSFSHIEEEKNFKDALLYKREVLGNLKNKNKKAFQYYEYCYLMYIVESDASWLGYINLYNDEFIKNAFQEFINLSLPLLEKIASCTELTKEYYDAFRIGKCTSFDIEQVPKLIQSYYLKCGGEKELLVNYFTKVQEILEERPKDLFIDFVLYASLKFSTKDIDNLLEELFEAVKKDPIFYDVNIIIKVDQEDIVLNPNLYTFKEERNNIRYFSFKKENVLQRCLLKKEGTENT